MRLASFAPLCLFALAGACSKPEAPAATPSLRLSLPIACVVGTTCEIQTYVDHDVTHGVKDYLCGPRTNDGHTGVDFRIPDMAAEAAGVAVLAAADGKVARMRDGMADVSIASPDAPIIAGQECGNGIVLDHGNGWETQYCHLAKGSVAVKVGEAVKAGQPIARVGLSGNTEFPHLHLTVRHDGVVVDPFAPDPYGADCKPQRTLWTPAVAAQLAYRAGEVLNAGFADRPVDMAAIEAGGIAPPVRGSAVLVAYVRAIGLDAGDVQEMTLKGPDGAVLAMSRVPPLDHAKAQYMMFVGKKRPSDDGWPGGVYIAEYRVLRASRVALAKSWSAEL
ncbi:M23 family metallopeptidase [Phenylobacterium sp.]|uniref:M23 family metallopeptidase n=1 Tax=Phenylobacterium sp. TaxID=1871053 RepID=UPI0035B0BB63